MIFLVSKNNSLFESEIYKRLSIEDALAEVSSWDCIQFDTETSGRDAHICNILCYQLGNDTVDKRIVVDALSYPVSLFKELLETKLIIGHNLKFDIQFLYKYQIIPTKVWDTMIVEQLLHLGFSSATFKVSLKEVTHRRLNVDMDKSTRGEIIWRGLDEKVILYAAYDVVYLEQIYKQQLKECNYTKCLNGAKLENTFVPVIAYMEWCGIHLDVQKWTSKMKKDQELYNNALNALDSWAVKYGQEHPKFPKMYKIPEPFLFEEMNTGPECTINWSSSQQVIPIMEALGFKVDDEDKKTGKSKKSVQEKVIAKQKGINDEFLKLYLDVKQTKIVCDTFGQKYIDSINPITGRIHTTFKQLGASSGRMSCGSTQENTDLKKYKHLSKGNCTYPQLQNLPSDHETRMAFTPISGNLMASADYSALESRLGADIYNEESMLEEYLEGSGDIHSLTAKHIFKELKDVPVKEIKARYPDLRKKAKPVE
jgi:DNA polymerase I